MSRLYPLFNTKAKYKLYNASHLEDFTSSKSYGFISTSKFYE